MNFKVVAHVVSALVAVLGIGMLSSVPVALLMGDSLHTAIVLLACSLVPLAAGVAASLLTKPSADSAPPGMREGFAIVVLLWGMISIFGSLPFIFEGRMFWYDAIYETVSGFTTTGATVIDSSLKLTDGSSLPDGVESLSYGLLYWRSMTHWLGGMGIVVLSIAILPFLGFGGQLMFNAESTGVKSQSDQITPRVASYAKILWGTYVLLTAAEVMLLLFGGMPLYDAVCHSFGTVSTGGFSTKQAGVAAFNSIYIDWIIIVFMFLGGCNFILHFKIMSGDFKAYFKDEEFKSFLWMAVIASVAVTTIIYGSALKLTTEETVIAGFADSFTHAAFQVVSFMSCTGFGTVDNGLWPASAAIILVILMFIGGCSGSTAGGLKVARIILLVKHSLSEMRRCIFPRSLPDIRLNGTRIEGNVIDKALSFFFLFVGVYALFTLLLSLVCHMDILTAATASIANLSNVGPGFGKVSSAYTFGWMNAPAKVLLSIEMIIGRLEIYTVAIMLLPSFWRK